MLDYPPVGPHLFADFHSGLQRAGRRSLLVYFNGALNERRYEERRATQPTHIFEVFGEIETADEAWDLLVIPPPPALTERGLAMRRIVAELVLTFVGSSPNPAPAVFAAVGMSYGAMLGCAFTLEADGCDRLATLAGVGMVEVVEAAPPEELAGKSFKCFVNDGDPLSDQSDRFAAVMAASGRRVEVIRRHGGHAFVDFVANGSAAEAFRFAMRGF